MSAMLYGGCILNIYIDESGSFVNAIGPGKWNAVAALAVAETSRRKLSELMSGLRQEVGGLPSSEIKIHQVSERSYFNFLEQLGRLDAVLFCVATDAGRNTVAGVEAHQAEQVERILRNKPHMLYPEGKQAVQNLGDGLRALPPQLYLQLTCQIHLMFDAISRSILYFVQRHPGTLRKFRWRVDRKDVRKSDYERAFERLSPALIQTMSMRQPIVRVKEFDYSSMQAYEFPDGHAPKYLEEVYGLLRGHGWNVGKLIREDMQFIDSRGSDGVQAVDLVVSGLRRCLRHQFRDNERASVLLGRLLVQAMREKLPLSIVGFGAEAYLDKPTSDLIDLMKGSAKPMLIRDA